MIEYRDIHQDLIDRCGRGDIKAQYNLYKLYVSTVYSTAMRYLNNKMDAEEVTQDTFITAFKKIGTYEGRAPFRFWIKKIAANNCLAILRKRKIIFEHIDNMDMANDGCEVGDDLDPAIVHSMIKQLPEGARVILNLFALEGYQHKEIAEMLGITESTSKTQFKRAKQLLLDKIKSVSDGY